MEYRVLFHPRAQQDLTQIHDYIAEAGGLPAAARVAAWGRFR
jgi:plasmid stabilization system protein ParE